MITRQELRRIRDQLRALNDARPDSVIAALKAEEELRAEERAQVLVLAVAQQALKWRCLPTEALPPGMLPLKRP